ncbi:MAG: hypothetical protein A2W90_11305 [Bacteroidetes bacterium GWF2_42_66]|nr:MAG: hypothetical protein A2W92_10295 [Bacteroidetes bacterium GWA2_42_15]OFY01837.1 MAG: hypothetical protein A2W89_23265 [Bacteroidetes bacterium GWE2_42_39]OFY44868.1 MAG: hypothetical protein A2W90_11305 [Bacteroidetes bacterium GWF2_42_66]HBL75996.1 hypothetical protein [Prolixibacteraceae bacterium]HCU62112.1 hypothetical protein [Prolixibacteraceae bacterium]
MKKLFITLAIASVAFISGCEKDEYQETVGVCPLVVSTVPIDKAVNVPLSQIITATFNEKMDPETITEASFLLKQGETSITGNVTYSGLTASLEPSVFLAPFTLYTGRVKTLAKDLMRNSLQTDYVWTFTTIPEVVLSSLPIAGGTTSGAGTFNQGSLVTVVATPNPGYSFANWTENGTAVSTNPSYQFTMAGNKALVANFTLQYVVNLLSNPVLGGTTSGSGSFNAGSNVTVTAFPNAEYNFVNWTEGTTIASTNAIYTFQLNASRTLVANYVLKTYTLNVTATNGTAVKNPSQLSYNSGTIVELTATPNTGYNFTSWSGDATGFINPLSVTMNANKNITANFAINTYTLNVTANNGTVVRNPNQATYNSGTTVQLTATPNAGYTFTSWSGDATGITNPLTVTMNANKNITANFTLNTYTLSVIANNGAVVRNPNQATYNSGTTVELTATPNAGYTFTSWSGDATGSSNPLTVTMNANKSIVANFTLNTYTLNVTANNGTVVRNPNQATYNGGTTVQLTATPNAGYTFTSWSGDATGSTNPLTVTMNADKNITANFTLNVYTLNVIANNGTVVKNPNQATYDSGTTVQLTATPNAGYTFTSWSGDATGSTNPLTVTMNANKNITANFTLNTYTLNVIANNGTVLRNPDQPTYDNGTTVQLTAIPNVGYTFVSWSGDATGSTNPLTVTMNADKNITANFVINVYTLNVTATNGSVLKNPDQPTYNGGTTVQLTATPNSGYAFISWSGDATGSTNPLTVTMNADKNITANFAMTGPLAIDLTCAAPYAVMAGSTITSTGPSIINGDVALSPGSALVGFPPGVINGTQQITTPIAAAAKLCLTTAYIDGQGRSLNAISLPGQLGGLTLAPGLYSNSSTSGISGTGANGILTLDAQGNSNAVWIFQIGSTLTTDPATSIVLAGGAQAANIFWIVGTSATLGTTSVFYGNILADQSITLNTGAVLNGRALTRIAAVSLDASTITKP